MLYLIKAAAYFDEKDNRLNRKYLDPVMHLAVHLDNEDPDLIKTVELLDKFKKSDKKNEIIGGFLQNWCCIRFSLSDHTKTECLNQLITLADQNDVESCCFLGETYRYGEDFKQDYNQSKKYFESGKAAGSIKAIESLAYVHQLMKRPDLSVENYALGAQMGSYTSLKIYGEYQIVGKFLP
jgi:TPR repeat protein